MKKAFTIIEVIVAITVLTIGVLGVSSFFASSVKLTTSANRMTTASNLAQGLIDEEVAKSYDELTPSTGTPTVLDSPYSNYKKQVNISCVTGDLGTCPDGDTGLKKIDVFVYWNEGSTEKNVQLSTLKSE